MLHTIISGGQTGADQAGLFAAEALGLHTGGMMPRGFRTDDGTMDQPDVVRFGMMEHKDYQYPPRTEVNVRCSDGTVLFGNPYSAGTKLTQELCLQFHRPCIVNPTIEGLRLWVAEHNIEILNVAGNRESRNPGIFDRTMAFLIEALLPIVLRVR